ncbi:FxsA family protein [Serinicoccus kebangsaanensis]|uniref:FxsA family protein n=1 Tax=Serinicoccus kebangsaanensis TaxID=2602069 RepID=UPI00124E113B|nr:FxsA family protein [Serinicoccus kebangsaanensis]
MSSTTGRTQPRRRPVLRWILLAIVLLPIVEIAVLVLVGQAIGLWWTLGLIVAVAVAGTWLARRESSRTYRALQQALNSGRMPADEMTDAILLMVGGVLLLLPGFVSDVVALVLVLPFTRPAARRLLQAVVASRALATVGGTSGSARPPRPPGAGTVIDGEIVDEQPPPWREQPPPPIDR